MRLVNDGWEYIQSPSPSFHGLPLIPQLPSSDTCSSFSSSSRFQSGSYFDSGGTSGNSWTSDSGSEFHTNFARRDNSWKGSSSSGYSDGNTSGSASSTNDEEKSLTPSLSTVVTKTRGMKRNKKVARSQATPDPAGPTRTTSIRGTSTQVTSTPSNFNSSNPNFNPKSYADAVPPHIKTRWREDLVQQKTSDGVLQCIFTAVGGTVLANATSGGVTLVVSQQGGLRCV